MQDSRVRTCIGCRRRQPLATLVRLRLSAQGAVLVGQGTGRGASIHPDAACIGAALRSGAFGRAFKQKVALPDGAALLAQLVAESLSDGTVKARAGQK